MGRFEKILLDEPSIPEKRDRPWRKQDIALIVILIIVFVGLFFKGSS